MFSLPFFWQQVQVLRNWPETDAQVLRSEVVAQPPRGHDNLYRAKLQVLYTVAGQPILAEYDELREHQLRGTPGSGPNSSRSAATTWFVTIRRIPAQARIGAGWNRTFFALPLIVAAMVAFFACVGAVLLAIAKAAEAN